jgi:hypothetical protein
MSTPVQFTLGNFPVGYCWPGAQQYGADLLALLTGEIASSTAVWNIGDTTPAPEDQDKPWLRTDANGYVDGVYTYAGGVWCRPHQLPPGSLETRIWRGTLEALRSHDGGDGTEGDPTETTGAMWVEDTDFAFRVPVGVGTNGTAYDGGSANSIALGAAGGEERVVLTVDTMPAHAHSKTTTYYNDAGANNPWGSGTSAEPQGTTTWNTDPNGGGDSHNNMPPYRGVYFIKRSARKYYTV